MSNYSYFGNPGTFTPDRRTASTTRKSLFTKGGPENQAFPEDSGITQHYDLETFIQSHIQLVHARKLFSSDLEVNGMLEEIFSQGSDSRRYEQVGMQILRLGEDVTAICETEEARLLQAEKYHLNQAAAFEKERQDVASFKTDHLESLETFEDKKFAIKNQERPEVLTVPFMTLALLAANCLLCISSLDDIKSVLHLTKPRDVTSLTDDETDAVLTVLKRAQEGAFRDNEDRAQVVDHYERCKLLDCDFAEKNSIRGDVKRHSKETLRAIIAINLGLVPPHIVQAGCVFVFRKEDEPLSCWLNLDDV